MIPIRRIFSFLLDVIIAAIPTYYAYLKQPTIPFTILFFISFTLLTALMSAISGKGTLGDRLLSLTTVSVTLNQISKPRLCLRNLTYCVYLAFCTWFAIDESNSAADEAILLITILALYLAVFSKKNVYRQNMTALDFVFGTTIIQKPWNAA